jgi:hypothetical protein
MQNLEMHPPLHESPDPANEFHGWLELPRDVTASILLRLGSIHILKSAQTVCSSWHNLCKEPPTWHTIDMRNTGWQETFPKLQKMCQDAVDRSCGLLVDINVEYFGTDELLMHIADKYFVIINSTSLLHKVSDRGPDKLIFVISFRGVLTGHLNSNAFGLCIAVAFQTRDWAKRLQNFHY